MTQTTGRPGTDLCEAAAEHAWRQRYASPEEMATIVSGLGPGPGRNVLLAFISWREQRLDDAASQTMTIGYDASVPHVWRSRALAVRSGLLAELGLVQESFGVREHALEQARLAGDLVSEIACVHGFGLLYEHSDSERAQHQYLQALRLIDDAKHATPAEKEQLDGLRAVAVVNLHGLEDLLGIAVPEWVPSLADVRDGALVAWPAMGAVVTAMLADQALAAGDLDSAARLESDLPDPRTMKDVALSSSVATARARLLAARGDVAAAVRLLEDVSPRLPPRHLPETLEALLQIHETAGDPAAALTVAKRLIQVTRRLHDSTTAAAVRALEVVYRTEHAEAEARRAARAARLASQTLGSLQEESTRDELTGVRNRRYLASVADRMLDHPGSAMAVVDIDRFKLFNDRLGHVVGDAVLLRVAEALTGTTRPEDVVARYGGDEFVVLRPAGGGASLAEDLHRITLLRDSAGLSVDGAEPVTLSIGVADTRTDWSTTFSLADEAMYVAKRAGGSGVHHAG